MKRNPLTGVRGRVTFTVLAITATLYSLLGTVGFVAIANGGRDAIRERVGEVLDQLEAGVRSGTGTVTLSTADGVEAVVVDPAQVPALPPGSLQVKRTVEIRGTTVVLVGTTSQARLTDSLRTLYLGLWIAIPLGAVLSALMAGMATHRALRPVGSITTLAGTIGSTHTTARVPVPDTGDEIESLANTLNAMLDRIEEGRSAQRRFTSDAAHELRTPLMALQGELEMVGSRAQVVDDALLERLDALCARLGERIDDLVLLSTLDEGRPLMLHPCDLAALARDEAAVVVPSAEVTGEPLEVSLDRDLVARAIRNLLANARRHASERIAVTVEVVGDRVWLHVDDDGPGIDPALAPSVFGRFTRLDEARTGDQGGAGLGLAIVASVAQAHGGGVAASHSPLGGARMSLSLQR